MDAATLFVQFGFEWVWVTRTSHIWSWIKIGNKMVPKYMNSWKLSTPLSHKNLCLTLAIVVC